MKLEEMIATAEMVAQLKTMTKKEAMLTICSLAEVVQAVINGELKKDQVPPTVAELVSVTMRQCKKFAAEQDAAKEDPNKEEGPQPPTEGGQAGKFVMESFDNLDDMMARIKELGGE